MKGIIKACFAMAVFAVIAAGCDKFDNGAEKRAYPVFTASFEASEEDKGNDPATKVYVDSDLALHWDANDEISAFYGTPTNMQYKFMGAQGDKLGEFEFVSEPASDGNASTLISNFAIYPYSSDVEYTTAGKLDRGYTGFIVSIPNVQKYALNSFHKESNVMGAVSSGKEDFKLNFKNLGSYLVLRLYGKDVTVKSIEIKSLAEREGYMTGAFYSGLAYNQNPIANKEIPEWLYSNVKLDCGTDGVKLGETKENAVDFWFVLIPGGTSKGFSVTIEDVNGKTATISTSNNILFLRNTVKRMAPREVVFN
ncbi:MAG: hypothetical protein E7119_00270 [Bacteroidales bacterium]|nr:hypothetical protein [Bacteroidales bacterium]